MPTAQPDDLATWLRVNDEAQTDGELLAATARVDDEAFAVLVRRYVRRVTLLGSQLLGNRDEAEDVTQDAFSVVYRKAGAFDAQRPFAPWLFGIVRRLAANRRSRELRRERLLRLFAWGAADRARASPQPDDALLAELEVAAATRAIQGLSPMQRACFELVAVRDLSTAEVAAMHGISESTVRQHVFRARAALRDDEVAPSNHELPTKRKT